MTKPPHQSHSARPPRDGAGDVCWLACGARSVETSISELTGLVGELRGQIALLEREPGFAVVQAQLEPEAVAHLKGALALSGASFSPPEAHSSADGVLIFILSSERVPGGVRTASEDQP